MNQKESARKTKIFVFNFLLNLDTYLFSMEGPYESFNTFLYNFGFYWSKHIMDEIIPLKVFSEQELEILTKIENCMIKLIDDYDSSGLQGWSYISKEDYLELKGLSYDYLRLVQESKAEW